MGTTEDLNSQVGKIVREPWKVTDGRVVPDGNSLSLSNHGVRIDATCLYADLADSTGIVQRFTDEAAGKIYKCYLDCACRIIRAQGGTITAFDGDRVMGIFVGDRKNSSAVRASLAINHAISKIVNPAFQSHYSNFGYQIKHAVGIDTGKLLVAQTGIRGSNDLVWVGPAANIAAKLCSIRAADCSVWITKAVHDSMEEGVRLTTDKTKSMWQSFVWNDFNKAQIYGSGYLWQL